MFRRDHLRCFNKPIGTNSKYLLPSEEREVLEVESISVAILSSCI